MRRKAPFRSLFSHAALIHISALIPATLSWRIRLHIQPRNVASFDKSSYPRIDQGRDLGPLDINSCIAINYAGVPNDAVINGFQFLQDITQDKGMEEEQELGKEDDMIQGLALYDGNDFEPQTLRTLKRFDSLFNTRANERRAEGGVAWPERFGSWKPVWLAGQGQLSDDLRQLVKGHAQQYEHVEDSTEHAQPNKYPELESPQSQQPLSELDQLKIAFSKKFDQIQNEMQRMSEQIALLEKTQIEKARREESVSPLEEEYIMNQGRRPVTPIWNSRFSPSSNMGSEKAILTEMLQENQQEQTSERPVTSNSYDGNAEENMEMGPPKIPQRIQEGLEDRDSENQDLHSDTHHQIDFTAQDPGKESLAMEAGKLNLPATSIQETESLPEFRDQVFLNNRLRFAMAYNDLAIWHWAKYIDIVDVAKRKMDAIVSLMTEKEDQVENTGPLIQMMDQLAKMRLDTIIQLEGEFLNQLHSISSELEKLDGLHRTNLMGPPRTQITDREGHRSQFDELLESMNLGHLVGEQENKADGKE